MRVKKTPLDTINKILLLIFNSTPNLNKPATITFSSNHQVIKACATQIFLERGKVNTENYLNRVEYDVDIQILICKVDTWLKNITKKSYTLDFNLIIGPINVLFTHLKEEFNIHPPPGKKRKIIKVINKFRSAYDSANLNTNLQMVHVVYAQGTGGTFISNLIHLLHGIDKKYASITDVGSAHNSSWPDTEISDCWDCSHIPGMYTESKIKRFKLNFVPSWSKIFSDNMLSIVISRTHYFYKISDTSFFRLPGIKNFKIILVTVDVNDKDAATQLKLNRWFKTVVAEFGVPTFNMDHYYRRCKDILHKEAPHPSTLTKEEILLLFHNMCEPESYYNFGHSSKNVALEIKFPECFKPVNIHNVISSIANLFNITEVNPDVLTYANEYINRQPNLSWLDVHE